MLSSKCQVSSKIWKLRVVARWSRKHQPSNKDDIGSRSAGSSEALSPRCQKVSSVPNFGIRRESIVSTSERVGEKDVLLESQASDSRSGRYESRLKVTPYFQLSGEAVRTLDPYAKTFEGSVKTLQSQLHVGALRSRQWERGTLL